MTTREAFDIVLDLATGNMCDSEEMPEEAARQALAIDYITVLRDTVA